MCVNEGIFTLCVILLFFSSAPGTSSVMLHILVNRVKFDLNVQQLLYISLQSFVMFTSESPAVG